MRTSYTDLGFSSDMEPEEANIILKVSSMDGDNSTETYSYPNINPILPKSPTVCCPFPPFPPPEDKKNLINNIIHILEKLKELV